MDTFAYCDVYFDALTNWIYAREHYADAIQKFLGKGISSDYLKYVTALEDIHVTILFSFDHNPRSMKFMNDIGIEGKDDFNLLNEASNILNGISFVPMNFEGFSKRNIFAMTGRFVPHKNDHGELDLNDVRKDTLKMMQEIAEANYEYDPEVVRNRILTMLANVPKVYVFDTLSIILSICVRELGAKMGEPYIPHCTLVQMERLFKDLYGPDENYCDHPEFYNGLFQALCSIDRIKDFHMPVDKMTMETW